MREYKTLKKLLSGEIINLDGILLVRDEGEIKPGDLYVAERNTGPKLLTCLKVVLPHEEEGYFKSPTTWQEVISTAIAKGYVVPTTNNYSYDLHECVKVREVT